MSTEAGKQRKADCRAVRLSDSILNGYAGIIAGTALVFGISATAFAGAPFSTAAGRIEPNVTSIDALVVSEAGQKDCQDVGQADDLPTKLSALLAAVEGPGFPGATNLATWPDRRADIHSSFGEILVLTANDIDLRRAAVEALLAAETLTADEATARRLSDRTRGEVRAWSRRVLKSYDASGATAADRKLISSDFITELKAAWKNVEAEHPQRTLPLYQERAGALRALAMSQKTGCG